VIQNSGTNTKFEDLDEIIARFAEPMIKYSKDIIAFQPFRFGDEKDIDELLHDEKLQNKNKIPYFLSFSSTPGRFIFSYLPNTKVRREAFSVTPNGYFHPVSKTYFKTPKKLVDFFKREIHRRDKKRRYPPPPSREDRHHHSHSSHHHRRYVRPHGRSGRDR